MLQEHEGKLSESLAARASSKRLRQQKFRRGPTHPRVAHSCLSTLGFMQVYNFAVQTHAPVRLCSAFSTSCTISMKTAGYMQNLSKTGMTANNAENCASAESRYPVGTNLFEACFTRFFGAENHNQAIAMYKTRAGAVACW